LALLTSLRCRNAGEQETLASKHREGGIAFGRRSVGPAANSGGEAERRRSPPPAALGR